MKHREEIELIPLCTPRSEEGETQDTSLLSIDDGQDIFRIVTGLTIAWSLASAWALGYVHAPIEISGLASKHKSLHSKIEFTHYTWLEMSMILYQVTALVLTSLRIHFPKPESALFPRVVTILLFLFWISWFVVGSVLLFADVPHTTNHTGYITLAICHFVYQLIGLFTWTWALVHYK